jgi:Fe-S cluster assembly ATP-binding protein
MGHPHYRITKGQILLNGHDITKLPTDQRAKLGLFLGFQYPVEVEGVSFSSFLRLATHHQDSNRTNFLDTLETMERQAKQLGFKNFDHTRSLGVGFSGGEKKRSEILQMLALRPKFAFLDEPDSGLDADGLNALAGTLNKLDFPTALVLISHHHKALDTFRPDIVHVLKSGKLVASGGAEVLQQIQKNGFKGL